MLDISVPQRVPLSFSLRGARPLYSRLLILCSISSLAASCLFRYIRSSHYSSDRFPFTIVTCITICILPDDHTYLTLVNFCLLYCSLVVIHYLTAYHTISVGTKATACT